MLEYREAPSFSNSEHTAIWTRTEHTIAIYRTNDCKTFACQSVYLVYFKRREARMRIVQNEKESGEEISI